MSKTDQSDFCCYLEPLGRMLADPDQNAWGGDPVLGWITLT